MCLHFLTGPYDLLQLYEDMDMAGGARTSTRFHQDMVMVIKCMLQGVYFLVHLSHYEFVEFDMA